ncbi:hypothetical protein [Streptomyces sp. NPDC059712]|uniref:hypothetical protein n=1 Tax=Streptomyces sp. NPDC059712 TaxID=3346919 RepID=UPI0036831B55
MQPTPERFGPARGSALFAAILWGIVITAAVFMALGDASAINAVIGCSVPAVFVTAWAIAFRRQDRQHELEGERRR